MRWFPYSATIGVTFRGRRGAPLVVLRDRGIQFRMLRKRSAPWGDAPVAENHRQLWRSALPRVICLAAVVALALPAAAQQSLGDVAGTIKLKRPEGELVVLDSGTVGQTRRARGGVTDRDFSAMR